MSRTIEKLIIKHYNAKKFIYLRLKTRLKLAMQKFTS